MQHLTLRSKLILAFLLVALIPMAILGFLNERAIQQGLSEDANQRLGANARQTASALNDFFDQNLNAVRSEAKLPVFTDYLLLVSTRKTGGPEETAVLATLRALSLKDFVNISSYALLDLRGINLIDTNGTDTGLDKSDRKYFRRPLESGLPYVSAVEINPEVRGENGLYFSAPVRDANGNIIGVMAARYRSAFLQRLIAEHNGLAGEASFAILLDENHLRLAHGTDPGQVFKTVVPLETARIAELQSNRRLPMLETGSLSTDNPAFEQGLANVAEHPYFQTALGADNSLHFVAVTEVPKLPWLVVYTQPQDTFLAPMRAYRNNTLLAGVVITGLAIVAAFVVAQLLSGPITRLTRVARKIGAGDLSARAQAEAADEIGSLANTLNSMTQNLETQISERENSEREAIANRVLLENAVEALEDGFVVFDDKDRLVLCNGNYRKIYAPYSEHWPPGTAAEKIFRDTVRDAIGIENEEEIEASVQRRLEKYRTATDWYEQHLKNDRWIRISEARLANGWTVGTRTDITHLKHIEADLQLSEAQFRDYAETAADYFWEMGADFRFTHLAGHYEQVTGVPPEQVIGLSREKLLTNGWAAFAEDSNPAPAMQAHQAFTDAELHWNHPDGRMRSLTISGKPIFDDEGGFAGYRGSGRDVTERKKAQQELEMLIKELELKNTELERFDYTISHELKSPLVTIAGFSGLLLDDAKTGHTANMTKHIGYITAAVEIMSELLDELLELSRIGRIINPPETFDIGELAQEISHSINPKNLGQDISIEIAPDLPEVYGDRVRIREVLQNLIGNSIKFCDDQDTTRVKIGSRNQESEEIIYVQDNGAGIDPEYHEKIFGLFERLNTNVDGTGIGLTLVQRILREHGGSIWVESEGVGKGSTFCFTIPGAAP